MALVEWKYNNPYIDRKRIDEQSFLFNGIRLCVYQKTFENIDCNRNTAYVLWDGAYLLSKYFENFGTSYWADKNCIELGSGCGLVGMVAWLMGANVTLTDQKECINHTQYCVTKNIDRLVEQCSISDHSVKRISVQPYDWGTSCSHLSAPFDVIIGSEVVYIDSLLPSLIDSFKFLAAKNTIIYLTYKTRGLGENKFFPLLDANGFKWNIISSVDHPREFANSEYSILCIKFTI